MTIEIQFGWWLIPAAITIAAFTASNIASQKLIGPPRSSDFFGEAARIVFHLIATVIALAAWLIWSLAT